MQLFGTSGIRRLVNADLVGLSLQVALAFGTCYKRVVIGRDTRTSGDALLHTVTAGLLASGARCSYAGIIPTPTLALAAREFDAGIMITASHNPPQYNGLKLLNPDGSAFSSEQQKQLEDLIGGPGAVDIRWDQMQNTAVYNAAVEQHIALIKQHFPGEIKIKVVVDSGCGAAYFITAELLTRLGCEVIALNGHASGFFPHDIEPIEANLGDLRQAVKESGADVGIAHDGDADRMMAVDERGRFISGDKMLLILAQASRAKTVVTTIDASMNIDEMHFKVKRTKVGDPYVSAELKRGGGFGGEPSGAWVFPQISLCPDGIYAAAQIASIASRQKLSALADSFPAYSVVRDSYFGAVTSIGDIKTKLQESLSPVSIETIDGLKLNFKDGWLLVRPSGTEPKIRLSVEARDEQTTRRLHETTLKILKAHFQENLA
jgi:phosphoglucosamine mutase